MSTEYLNISPIDAWFFRDGRPYNDGETTQTDVASLFPPLAPTVVGALRAAIAREHGWSGYGKWSPELIDVLGDGFDEHDGRLGQLRFCGPYVHHSDKKVLFPIPLHVLGTADDTLKREWSPFTLLKPGNVIATDLGDVRLPVANKTTDGLKDGGARYLDAAGLARVLAGEVPGSEHVFETRTLWAHERRVGLKRDEHTRTTGDAALYSPHYIRLEPDVSLVMGIEGRPQDNWEVPALFTLGGESRMAAQEPLGDFDLARDLPAPTAIPTPGKGGVTITLLTPALFDDSPGKSRLPGPNETLPGLDAAVIISACIGKPVFIGGWNSLKREPLPLTPFLPAGTTWFCTVDPGKAADLLTRHLQHIGLRTAYGFGQIALGVWHEDSATS
ncbi:MAG: type III-B CRISPR module-associated Cmr3 family protein [Bradymonadaceae bacterium]